LSAGWLARTDGAGRVHARTVSDVRIRRCASIPGSRRSSSARLMPSSRTGRHKTIGTTQGSTIHAVGRTLLPTMGADVPSAPPPQRRLLRLVGTSSRCRTGVSDLPEWEFANTNMLCNGQRSCTGVRRHRAGWAVIVGGSIPTARQRRADEN
jgi:hypothetical protein